MTGTVGAVNPRPLAPLVGLDYRRTASALVLFTSYEFVLVFLPATLLAVWGASSVGHRGAAKVLLLLASLIFYAWWNPPYLAFLIALLSFNFVVGSWLSRTQGPTRRRLAVLVFGLAANIGALVYFKYTNFLVGTISDAFGLDFTLHSIVLPLGISFIVFQKIAFLVDAYNGQIKELDLLDYGLFVSFFPQLISGPIVHHREVMPQFQSDASLRYNARLVPVAITFIVLGAFKKVVIADHFSSHVAIAFKMTSLGAHHDLFGAWLSAVGYTLQIYFDFSGYSDMAIGLGLMFGVRLPFNFNSPLKARSIIEFWTRWHMTLTRFLTAYVYNPIVVRVTRARIRARKRISSDGKMLPGAFVKVLALPTLFTFFIAGAWHGAGFQFVAFGMLHGVYLVVNYGWRNLRRAKDAAAAPPVWHRVLARAATFLAVVIAIPFFRADSLRAGARFVSSMLGLHGIHPGALAADRGFLLWTLASLLVVQLLPNTQELMRVQLDATSRPLEKHPGDQAEEASYSWPTVAWRPTTSWAVAIALTGWLVVLLMAAPSEFLYFQF